MIILQAHSIYILETKELLIKDEFLSHSQKHPSNEGSKCEMCDVSDVLSMPRIVLKDKEFLIKDGFISHMKYPHVKCVMSQMLVEYAAAYHHPITDY